MKLNKIYEKKQNQIKKKRKLKKATATGLKVTEKSRIYSVDWGFYSVTEGQPIVKFTL